MDDITLLKECMMKVEEVKEEIVDITENVGYDVLRNSTITTEFSRDKSQVKKQNELEEEVKPSITVFLQPKEDMAEETEEEDEEEEDDDEDEEDSLALSGDDNFKTPEETEAGVWTQGDPDNDWGDESSSEDDSRPHQSSTQRRLQCTVCNEHFRSKSRLARHMQMNACKKPYECVICHVSFKFKSTLVKHSRTHTGEKPFKCPICGKLFTHEESLHLHLQTIHYTRYKNMFQCSVCKKQYSMKMSLNQHMQVHTKEKLYRCSVCQKSFTEKFTLVKHYKRHSRAERNRSSVPSESAQSARGGK